MVRWHVIYHWLPYANKHTNILACRLLSLTFEYRCLLKLKGRIIGFYEVSFYQICLQS